MSRGTLSALGAYLLWGLLPIYWKTIRQVPATEILIHRMVWSFVFMALVLAARRHWGWVKTAVSSPRTLVTFIATAALLSVNWLTYIWGVNNGHVVAASLGYFMNPLVNVLLGVAFLSERLRRLQWLAIAVAAIGVIYLALSYSVALWISLTLAFSFGLYGLLRKTAPLNSREGLTMETAVFFIPALSYLLYLESQGQAAFGHSDGLTNGLLAGAGAATAVPLLLFAYGARRVTLTTLGILQYVAPSLQFLIGVLIYGEPFTSARMIGFGIIWIALAIYTGEGIYTARERRAIRKREDWRLEIGD